MDGTRQFKSDKPLAHYQFGRLSPKFPFIGNLNKKKPNGGTEGLLESQIRLNLCLGFQFVFDWAYNAAHIVATSRTNNVSRH